MFDLRTLFDASLLDHTLLGATVERWLLLVGAVLASTLVLMLLRRGLSHLIGRYAEGTSTYVDNVIAALLGKTRGYFLFTAALYGAAFFLGWSERGMRLAGWLLVLALVLQVVGWANAFLTLWTDRYRERNMEENAASVTTVQALVFLGRVALWIVVALVVLDHLGVEVTALVAGLGVGGIAIGLAMQNVLSDLFASLSIVFDKPFVLGDMLDVDGLRGTVEHIGLKSTRVRSTDGEQIVFANNDLLSSRVRNLQRVKIRRVVFTVGLVYRTPPERLRAVPDIVETIMQEIEDVRYGWAHFTEYGDSSLNFEIAFFVRGHDLSTFRKKRHAVNLAIFERFAEEGLEFAYPTRTLYHETTDAPPNSEDMSADDQIRTQPSP